MKLKIVSPLSRPDWNRQIQSLKGSTIFHTANWAHVLVDSYGYQPLYFSTFTNHRLNGCIPLIKIDSFLTGQRCVSLPFADECRPLGDEANVSVIWNAIIRHEWARLEYIELRGDMPFCDSAYRNSHYKTHILKLNIPESELLRRFRDSTRRNISKSEKQNVKILFSRSLRSLKEF